MSIFSSNRERETNESTDFGKNIVSTPASATAQSSSSSMSNITTIASGTIIDGNIKIDGDLRLEGNVKGTVMSKGKVIVGTTGKIEGDVLCQHAEISGKVNGKLQIADILFLKSNAQVDGDIKTGKLVMESGVIFNGNCTMGSVATVPSSSASATTNTASASPAPTTANSNS